MICFRSVVAEKMGPVCTSSDGSFCFSGGESGLIYVWDTRSGNILNAVCYIYFVLFFVY